MKIDNIWRHVTVENSRDEALDCIGEPSLVHPLHGSLIGFCGRHGLWDWFDALLERGANPQLADADGKPAGWHALPVPSRLRNCLGHGLCVRGSVPRGMAGEGWVQAAVGQQSWDSLNLLMDAGADVNWASPCGDTALHLAATMTTPTWVVRKLITRGGEVGATDERGWTPLHWAVHEDHQAAAWELLQAGADWHARESRGRSAWDFWQMRRSHVRSRGREIDAWCDRLILQKAIGGEPRSESIERRI